MHQRICEWLICAVPARPLPSLSCLLDMGSCLTTGLKPSTLSLQNHHMSHQSEEAVLLCLVVNLLSILLDIIALSIHFPRFALFGWVQQPINLMLMMSQFQSEFWMVATELIVWNGQEASRDYWGVQRRDGHHQPAGQVIFSSTLWFDKKKTFVQGSFHICPLEGVGSSRWRWWLACRWWRGISLIFS